MRTFKVEMCMRKDNPHIMQWWETDLNFGALRFNLQVWAILIIG